MATNGAAAATDPDGECENRGTCDDAGCADEWWYLPASAEPWRALQTVERAVFIAQGSVALAAAEVVERRAMNALATRYAEHVR
jgi:hypothetical protein